jgi:hypothetical protein
MMAVMKSMPVALGSAVAILLGAGFSCHDNSKTCTTAGCSSGALMQLAFAAGASSLPGNTVNVCRNAECHSAVLPALPDVGGAGAVIVFADTTAVMGTMWLASAQSLGMDLEWHVDDASLLANGDHYTVSLGSDPSTATVLLDKTATYQILTPNGETCPPVCTYVVLAP